MPTLLEYLYEQNPWWNKNWSDVSVPRPHYLKKIEKYLNTPEITVISGVRRSGKSTLMRQAINYLIKSKTAKPNEILFVSCDSEVITSLKNPLETVVDTFKKETGNTNHLWLFFDEIQVIDNFPSYLKSWRDTGNYKIIISGSSSYLLESKTGSMLGGRYLPITVYPLSFSEYLSFANIPVPKNRIEAAGRKYEFIGLLRTYIKKGGFPALVALEDEELRKDYLHAYYDSIIYRDILSTNPVRNRNVMESLYSYILTNISSPQNYSSLAKQFSCDNTIIRDYIKYAEDGWLFYVVKHFSYSLRKQNLSPKKIYAVDNGLRSAVSFVFSEDMGRLAENVVMIELKRRGFSAMYWTDKHEIDFVVKNDDNSLLLINVCLSDEIPDRETKGFAEFKQMYPDINTTSLLLTEDFEGIIGDVKCIPLWKWLINFDA